MAGPNKTIDQMSDEEISNLVPGSPEFFAATQMESETTDHNPEETNQEVIDPGTVLEPVTPDVEDDAGSEDPNEAQSQTEEVEEVTPAVTPTTGTAPVGEANPATDAGEPGAKQEAEVPNYEDIGKQVLAPFKANGREIQVKSSADAIALMQMGANYHAKMAGLKPNLAILKLLEKNELLDPSRINYLIDLAQKKPEAISKLVKDSGIEPMDLDTENTTEYSPTNRVVDHKEIELDEVLADLKGTNSYGNLLNTVANNWDEPSKQVVLQNPQVLRGISINMENGIYDMIVNTVANERMLGRLSGLSDIEAYRQVGDAMNARGDFNGMFKQNTTSAAPTTNQPVVRTVVSTAPKNAIDPQTAARKRAAGSTTTTPGAAKQIINPLDMSDDEFLKLGGIQYLDRD